MRVLIAVDSFKGSLNSLRAGEAIAEGIYRVLPNASAKIIPIADGGEGTVDAMLRAGNGRSHVFTVSSPVLTPVEATLGILDDGTAVIEMAAASGLPLLAPEQRNPLLTTTFGTGELILNALDLGAKKIVLGIGGSATNDGGAGMAQALGVRFLDRNGIELEPGGGALGNLESIDVSGLDPRLRSVEVVVMCDVNNPLCGKKGASVVYGPQKGATPDMVEQLDQNLKWYALKIKEQLGIDVKDLPGAGAAGGLGAGLLAFVDAQLLPGVEALLDTIGFDEMAKCADLIITGEGRIDGQSVHGKVPMGVACRALKYSKPVIAIVGSIGSGAEVMYQHGIEAIYSIVNGPMTLEDAMLSAYDLTRDCAERTFKVLKLGNRMGNI